MAKISDKLRSVLKDHNLDIDKAIVLLGVQDWQLEEKNDIEIMQTVMKIAEEKISKVQDAEIMKIILRETIREYKLEPNEAAAEFHKRQWVN